MQARRRASRRKRRAKSSSTSVERKGVRAHESSHVRAQSRRDTRSRRIAAAASLAPRSGCFPFGPRLAEIVEERAEPHRERRARVRRGLHDREDVLVERQVLPFAVCSKPIACSNSGRSAASTPVSRASRSARAGSAPSRSFESSPIPSAPSPPPTRSPETSATLAASARICASVSASGSSPSSRDETQAPHETQWILGEATSAAPCEARRSSDPPRRRTDRRSPPSPVASRSR